MTVEVLAVYDADKPRAMRKRRPEGWKVYEVTGSGLIAVSDRLWASYNQACKEAESVG